MNSISKKQAIYPWLVMCAAVVMCICASLLGGSFAISLSCVRNELELTGAQTGVFTTIRSLSAFLIVLVFDKWFGFFGLRKGIALGLLSGVISMAFFSFAGTNLMIYNIGAVFGGICYGLCLMAAASIVIKKWFNKSRGLAVGICAASTGLCNFIFSPLIQSVANSANCSAAFLMQLGVIVFAAIFCFLIIRDDPTEMGLEPFGGKDYDPAQDKKKSNAPKVVSNIFLNKKYFWVYAAVIVVLGMAATPSQTYIPTCLNTVGYDSMAIAWGASVSGLIMIGSKTVFGILVDKIGTKWTNLIYSCIIGFGCYGVIFSLGFITLPSFVPYLVYIAFGIGGAACAMGYTMFALEWSDPKEHSANMKLFQSAYQLGGLVASPLPGIVFDVTGSYTNWYIVSLIGYLLMAGVGFLFCTKLDKMRKNAETVSAAVEA